MSPPLLHVRCSLWPWWPMVFERAEVPIGRFRAAPTHDLDVISLRDSSVSRRHATLQVSGGSVWVTDLASSGGIDIDGQRVTRARLEPTSTLRVGTLTLSAWLAPLDDHPGEISQASAPDAHPTLLDDLAHRSMSVAERVASNPSTPSGLLVALRACPALAIHHALACNPSLPQAQLHELWNHFPLAMARNPASLIASVADPTLSFLTEEAALWLLSHRPPDPFFASLLASHPSGSVRILARAVLTT